MLCADFCFDYPLSVREGDQQKMAAKGCYLPASNLPQTQFSVHHTKTEVLPARGNFPRVRESFCAQQYNKLKNIEVCCANDARISINQTLPELSFDRLQPTVEECTGLQSREFGSFVAREAIVDEEYWTAAWLRAEAHWESVSYMRHIDSYKKKYAEQEFYALKRRCFGQDGNSLKCFCLVAVKKEDPSIRRTVLNSTVGTLDLSIRQFVQGETYPGEIKRRYSVFASQEPFDTHKYAYIANVCVAKFARRQGIASNMLQLAWDVAIRAGQKRIFVHVNADNNAARRLYEKTGFKVSVPTPVDFFSHFDSTLCNRIVFGGGKLTGCAELVNNHRLSMQLHSLHLKTREFSCPWTYDTCLTTTTSKRRLTLSPLSTTVNVTVMWFCQDDRRTFLASVCRIASPKS